MGFFTLFKEGKPVNIRTASNKWSINEKNALNIKFENISLNNKASFGTHNLIKIKQNEIASILERIKAEKENNALTQLVLMILESQGWRNRSNNGFLLSGNEMAFNQQTRRCVFLENFIVTAISDFECYSNENSWLTIELKKKYRSSNSQFQIAAQLIAIGQLCQLRGCRTDRIYGLRFVEHKVYIYKLEYKREYFDQLINGLPRDELIIRKYPEGNKYLDLKKQEDLDFLAKFLEMYSQPESRMIFDQEATKPSSKPAEEHNWI